MNDESTPKGAHETTSKKSTAQSTAVLAPTPAHDAASRFRDAYAVLVIGKAARRHVFFGLPAAEKAVRRARARGDYADLVLVRLLPVSGELDG